MTNEKKKFNLKKCLVCAIVVLSVLVCVGLTANAVTDGAVTQYIAENLKESFKITVNGKPVESVDFVYDFEESDDGKKTDKYKFEYENGVELECSIINYDDGEHLSEMIVAYTADEDDVVENMTFEIKDDSLETVFDISEKATEE